MIRERDKLHLPVFLCSRDHRATCLCERAKRPVGGSRGQVALNVDRIVNGRVAWEKFRADPGFLKPYILYSRRRAADANSRPGCFAIDRSDGAAASRDHAPLSHKSEVHQ